MPKKDRFTQLVDDLQSGAISENMLQIAYRASIKQNPNLKGFADILGGSSESNAGIIYKLMTAMFQVAGGMELAYRRGCQVSVEATKEQWEKVDFEITAIKDRLKTITDRMAQLDYTETSEDKSNLTYIFSNIQHVNERAINLKKVFNEFRKEVTGEM